MSVPSNIRSIILQSLLLAGALLLAAWVVRTLPSEVIGRDTARRVMGCLFGLLAAYYANQVPKALTPWARLRCGAAAEQSLRRFMGVTLMLGALASTIAWLLAPIDSAGPISIAALGLALALVMLRLLWTKVRAPRP
jgi:hypothetical protein